MPKQVNLKSSSELLLESDKFDFGLYLKKLVEKNNMDANTL